MLPDRALGSQGLRVSALGLGCMGMSTAYGTPNDAESMATLQRAVEQGVTLFDTAEIYGPHTNERLVGAGLRGVRDQVAIATKFGFRIVDGQRQPGLDSRPAGLAARIDACLQRLGTDRIDLLYQHRVDPEIPIEDVVGAMADLVRAGKVRFLGLSEAGPATIRRAHATHPISAVQSEYSLWERGVEAGVLPVLRELGIGFVPFSPLGRGFLTGTAQRAESYAEGDYRRGEPRLQGANFDANQRLADAVGAVARDKGVTPGQLALAWLLHQGDDIVPIPGTKRRTYLDENLGAVAIRLRPEDTAALAAAVPPGATAGPRYTPAGLAMLDT